MAGTTDADVVIVGGGIAGVTSAYQLARAGVRVRLLEMGSIGGAQSGQNGGWVRMQGRDPAEIPLMKESKRMWANAAAEMGRDVGWVQAGNLGLADEPGHFAKLQAWVRSTEGFDLDSRIVDPQEVERLIPAMAGTWLGGSYTPSDGHAEPRRATEAFAAAAMDAGAVIETATGVLEIVAERGRVTGVRTTSGVVNASTVVCAAGAASSRLLRGLGLDLPVRIVRSTVVLTTPVEPVTQIAVWSPRVAFRQRGDGSFTLAAAGTSDFDVTLESLRHLRLFLPNYWANRGSIRLHVGRLLLKDVVSTTRSRLTGRRDPRGPWPATPPASPAKTKRCLAEHHRLFPGLSDVRLADSWAGYIDTTPDAIPVIGPVRQLPGLILATGFSGHGFGLGPMTGRLVKELIVEGRPSMDLSAFRFERFAEGQVGGPRHLI